MAKTPKILITGASGQLGRLVIAHLLKTIAAGDIGAMVRRDDGSWAASGIAVLLGDYTKPATLRAAFRGVEKLLLISSNEVGERAQQHGSVIAAAKESGVQRLVYTSVLHADTSTLGLAEEHRQTERAIIASGVPHVFLRNGWYTENYTGSVQAALAHGAVIGSAGEGRISAASRNDYAEAAAKVLTAKQSVANDVYELAGDTAFTMAEFAAELSRQTSQKIVYQDLPAPAFEAALVKAGLPAPLASMLADSSLKTAQGALFDGDHVLSRLIGRATTSLAASIAIALKDAAET